MAIDFFNPAFTNNQLNRAFLSDRKNVIKTSKDVSGIELRMMPPYIKDNHTSPVWPFPGFAKLYCLTIVVSDVTNQLAGAIDLKGFPRIGDNEYLPINKTVLYWQAEADNDKAPNQIHIFSSIIKSKQGLRDTGAILSEVKEDKGYKSLMGNLAKIAKDAARFNVVADTVMQIAGIVGKYLGSVEDKPIGTIINSYTTLHGDFDNTGITTFLYNTSDVDFKFNLVVRNKAAEAITAKGLNGKKAVAKKKEKEEVEVDMQPL